MTPEMETARARDAALILENPLFSEAFEAVRNGIYKSLEQSDNLGPEDVTRLWLSLRMVAKVRGWFEGVIQTGKLAQAQIDAKAKKRG